MLFGQKRADPTFSTKKDVPDYLKGRLLVDVADDLRSGKLSTDDIRIEAFEYDGQLVSTNTRGLSALSLAGKRPTNVVITPLDDLPKSIKKRLKEVTLHGDTLPAERIPITPDRDSEEILYDVRIP